MSENRPDYVPPTVYEQTGRASEASVKVRASEFRGLTGKLSSFELIGAAALGLAAVTFLLGLTWRVLT
jgi:hypothetical protein